MSICKDCFHSYVCEQFNEHRECDNTKCYFFNDHFVSPADVVKVVRCKDCKYFEPLRDSTWINQNRKDGICYALVNFHDSERYCVQPDHYCSYGERKDKV